MKALDIVAAILVIVGALNWGLVGAFNFNLVAAIFGTSVIANIVYILVGLSGVYEAIRLSTAPAAHRGHMVRA
ncbi:MAG TPA: DUF378 domain-containing protein [Tepidisphaeraceae bacterium]|jgi:hypothetical protein